jgi:uncharacterized protein YgbK (DUF1537 family)
MRVLIVADDLTGALDTAAPFSAAGLKTIVAPFRQDIPRALGERPDVLAVNSNSRDLSAAEARAAVACVLAELSGCNAEIVFKKVDSRLKGHPALEAAAVGRCFRRHLLLVAPAIPELGRVVVDGRVSGHAIGSPIDIVAAFADADVPFEIGEASSVADMATIAGRLLRMPDDTLAVGASGLARALAGLLGGQGAGIAAASTLAAPVLFAIGSRDPVTREQVERLLKAAPQTRTILCVDGIWPDHAAVPPPDHATASEGSQRDAGGKSLHGYPRPAPERPVLAMMVEGGRRRPIGAAGADFGKGVANLLTAGFSGTVLVSGGNTMAAVLRSLNAGPLLLAGEWRPGQAVSIPLSGALDVRLISKSGGFGQPDSLVELLSIGRGA